MTGQWEWMWAVVEVKMTALIFARMFSKAKRTSILMLDLEKALLTFYVGNKWAEKEGTLAGPFYVLRKMQVLLAFHHSFPLRMGFSQTLSRGSGSSWALLCAYPSGASQRKQLFAGDGGLTEAARGPFKDVLCQRSFLQHLVCGARAE